MKVPLTQAMLNHVLYCATGEKRTEIFDSVSCSGLFIEVYASCRGRGVFYYRYKDANGLTCQKYIGRTGKAE